MSITPYYQSERVTLYHGDALAVLPTLGSVEAVITDIPYNVINRPIGAMRTHRTLDKGIADSAPVDVPQLVAALAPLAPSHYVWCSTEQVSDLRAGFVAARMTTRHGVWIKTNPSPLNGDKLWLSATENCVYARKVNATFNRFCEAPVWRGPAEKVKGFPCPKPLWLMRELIDASSSIDGAVLDPFTGSGTTGVAAIQLGRHFIGIELEERYCEIAAKRIQEAEQKYSLIEGAA